MQIHNRAGRGARSVCIRRLARPGGEREVVMTPLLDDPAVVQRILDHIDHETTDRSADTWREPVENYRSPERFAAERDLVLRRYPTPFCASAALPAVGSYVARAARGTPILAVRDDEGRVHAFRNACRHRGAQLVEGAAARRPSRAATTGGPTPSTAACATSRTRTASRSSTRARAGSSRSRRSSATASCSSRRTRRTCPTSSCPISRACSHRRCD